MPHSLSVGNVQNEAPPGQLALLPGWLAFAAPALAIPVSALIFTRAPATPAPVLGELPSFQLVDESGSRFSRDQLAGRSWIADFVFTS